MQSRRVIAAAGALAINGAVLAGLIGATAPVIERRPRTDPVVARLVLPGAVPASQVSGPRSGGADGIRRDAPAIAEPADIRLDAPVAQTAPPVAPPGEALAGLDRSTGPAATPARRSGRDREAAPRERAPTPPPRPAKPDAARAQPAAGTGGRPPGDAAAAKAGPAAPSPPAETTPAPAAAAAATFTPGEPSAPIEPIASQVPPGLDADLTVSRSASGPAPPAALAATGHGSPAAVAGPAVQASASASPARVPRAAPRVDASWGGNAAPPYPAAARRMGEQGEVRLDVHVAADGTVTEVRLRASSGSAVLDRSAIDTVRRWRFSPATVDGRAVAEWYRDWRWVFKLEG
jgi:protein TonB